MESPEERRAFLVGMTLNELVFLLLFLLLIVSAVLLKGKADELNKQSAETRTLWNELEHSRQQLDEAFKKLVLQEAMLSRLSDAGRKRPQEEMDSFFRRLVEDQRKARQYDRLQAENRVLHNQVRRLEEHEALGRVVRRALQDSGLEADPRRAVEALLQAADRAKRNERDLEGRVAYLSMRLDACRGTGLDHPPCWADPASGAIEYLFRITIHEDGLQVEPAWPPRREADLRALPGAEAMVGRRLSTAEFRRLARPILDWSKARGCRHFVRIHDEPATSKRAFKQGLLTIEAYFYKLLERG